jgi:hypothetical protein
MASIGLYWPFGVLLAFWAFIGLWALIGLLDLHWPLGFSTNVDEVEE